jgi:2-amino-4-hydroxy-6-hydroxymethyldihydropteridine diphosphokinase
VRTRSGDRILPGVSRLDNPAAVALGSNLGDRRAAILGAIDALAHSPGVRLIGVSSIHETRPISPIPQGLYLNAAVTLRSSLPPRDLLGLLFTIERSFGRDRAREQRWGPRTLDLDLLLYADRIIEEPGLTIPHPRLHERLFVLDPLAEIAPDWVVPSLGRTVRSLRDAIR